MECFYKPKFDEFTFDRDKKIFHLKINDNNIVYIQNNDISLDELYAISVIISRKYRADIILKYRYYIILINENTKKVDVTDQVTRQDICIEDNKSILLQNDKIEKALINGSLEDIETEIISLYQLYKLNSSNLPFISKFEDVKKIKSKKGIQKICNC